MCSWPRNLRAISLLSNTIKTRVVKAFKNDEAGKRLYLACWHQCSSKVGAEKWYWMSACFDWLKCVVAKIIWIFGLKFLPFTAWTVQLTNCSAIGVFCHGLSNYYAAITWHTFLFGLSLGNVTLPQSPMWIRRISDENKLFRSHWSLSFQTIILNRPESLISITGHLLVRSQGHAVSRSHFTAPSSHEVPTIWGVARRILKFPFSSVPVGFLALPSSWNSRSTDRFLSLSYLTWNRPLKYHSTFELSIQRLVVENPNLVSSTFSVELISGIVNSICKTISCKVIWMCGPCTPYLNLLLLAATTWTRLLYLFLSHSLCHYSRMFFTTLSEGVIPFILISCGEFGGVMDY